MKFLSRGEWEFEEDIKILEFVMKDGLKWAQISKNLIYRTEHSVKNRFFSLLSNFLSMTIKEIKKNIDYSNKNLIKQTLKYHCDMVNEEINSQFENLDLSELNDEEIFNLIANSDMLTLQFYEFLES